MREQLAQYVELLFAGAPDSEEIKEEILQNTLDRYDDLIAQGKVPQAAYRLAIAGIGDISEILGTAQPESEFTEIPRQAQPETTDSPWKKNVRAIAIGLYIISVIPLFILSEAGYDTLGLCATLSIVAVATAAIVMAGKKEPDEGEHKTEASSPRQELDKSVRSLIGIVTLAVYLILSFVTGAWFITWLIFPISGAVRGLVKAILDLKEAAEYEN